MRSFQPCLIFLPSPYQSEVITCFVLNWQKNPIWGPNFHLAQFDGPTLESRNTGIIHDGKVKFCLLLPHHLVFQIMSRVLGDLAPIQNRWGLFQKVLVVAAGIFPIQFFHHQGKKGSDWGGCISAPMACIWVGVGMLVPAEVVLKPLAGFGPSRTKTLVCQIDENFEKKIHVWDPILEKIVLLGKRESFGLGDPPGFRI